MNQFLNIECIENLLKIENCKLIIYIVLNVMRTKPSVSVLCLAPIICGAGSLDE